MSDLDIIRRIAERGLAEAQKSEDKYIDIFQHLLDELARIKELDKFSSSRPVSLRMISLQERFGGIKT